MDFLEGLLMVAEGAKWIFFVLLLWAFYKGIVDKETPIDWWEFVATRGISGKLDADVDKLGKVVAIIVSSYIVISVSVHVRPSGTEFAGLLGLWLAFAGAVAGWASYLRSKAGIATTVVTTEPVPVLPVPPPQKVTTTTTEPAAPASTGVPTVLGVANIKAETAIVTTGELK